MLFRSRSQKASPEQLEFCVKQIQTLNPKAAIITTPWDEIQGSQILKVIEGQDNLEMKTLAEAAHEAHEHEHHHDHDHEDVNSDLEHYKENPVNQNDEVCGITTKNMKQAIFPVSFKTSGASVPCNLLLTFDGDKCTISTDDEGVTVSGEGEIGRAHV